MNSIRNIAWYAILACSAFACHSMVAMEQSSNEQKFKLMTKQDYQDEFAIYAKNLQIQSSDTDRLTDDLRKHKEMVDAHKQRYVTLHTNLVQFKQKSDKLRAEQVRLEDDKKKSSASKGKCESVHLIKAEDIRLKALAKEYAAEKERLQAEQATLDALDVGFKSSSILLDAKHKELERREAVLRSQGNLLKRLQIILYAGETPPDDHTTTATQEDIV